MGPGMAAAQIKTFDFAIVDAHAIDGRAHLLEVGDVGADAQRVSTGMLDFQMRQVQFGFAAREQRHAISRLREPERQTFADASSGPRYQHTGVGQSVHWSFNQVSTT